VKNIFKSLASGLYVGSAIKQSEVDSDLNRRWLSYCHGGAVIRMWLFLDDNVIFKLSCKNLFNLWDKSEDNCNFSIILITIIALITLITIIASITLITIIVLITLIT